MLYIFLVETSSESKSDERYIKSLIDLRYNYYGHKLKFIYLKGKYNYSRKEFEIRKWKTKYNGLSKVFMCIDLDNDTSQLNNSILNEKIFSYCCIHGYELIWFYENIEQVFLGKNVDNSSKKQEAIKFYRSNKIKSINLDNLSHDEVLRKKTSNIIKILDNYLNLKWYFSAV